MNRTGTRQKGVALLMALMFLVVITLIALNSMRTSTLELKMAGNEQLSVEAAQSAQSAVDGIIDPSNFKVIQDGYTVCFNKSTTSSGATCDEQKTLSGGAYSASTNQVEVRLESSGTFVCRVCETSANHFEAAQFSVRSQYRDGNNGSSADIGQGLLMFIPANN